MLQKQGFIDQGFGGLRLTVNYHSLPCLQALITQKPAYGIELIGIRRIGRFWY